MEAFSLKSCVILGYTDVAAAGSRTLLGFDSDKYAVHSLPLKSYIEATPTAVCESSTDTPPVVLICNHKTRDVSFIIINAVFPTEKKHVVANEIIDLISCSNVQEFIILSAFPIGCDSAYLKIIDADLDHESTSKLHSDDPFLNALLQFTIIESFATLLIVADGRKATRNSSPNLIDGSMQSIHSLHKYLQYELRLDLDLKKSCSWVYEGDVTNIQNSLMYI